jgi:hypothetical protein
VGGARYVYIEACFKEKTGMYPSQAGVNCVYRARARDQPQRAQGLLVLIFRRGGVREGERARKAVTVLLPSLPGVRRRMASRRSMRQIVDGDLCGR